MTPAGSATLQGKYRGGLDGGDWAAATEWRRARELVRLGCSLTPALEDNIPGSSPSGVITPVLSPSTGILPVAISYSTAPKEKRSVRVSNSFARTCSGDM